MNWQDSDKGTKMLLVKKQADLESIYQKHDSLVREMFHMEHFRSMIGYDPEEAKKDDSAVFLDYKAMRYDILDKTTSTSDSVAGPSRRTRSAQQSERMQLFQPSLSSPLLPLTSPMKSLTKDRRKWKDNSSVWDILATARTKSKGKEKAVDMTVDLNTGNAGGCSQVNDSKEFISFGLRESRSRRHRPRGLNPEPPSISRSASDTSSVSGVKRITPAPPIVLIPTRRKRRKTNDGTPALLNDTNDPGGTSFERKQRRPSVTPPRASRMMSIRGTAGHGVSSTTPVSSSVPNIQGPLIPTSPFNIKRIKLIVRRPPPLLSSPVQKPPPPRYNGSLSVLLNSFTTLDGQETNDEVVKTHIHSKASLLEKASQLRKEGRYFPEAESLAAEVAAMSDPSKKLERQTKDVWDHCIEDVIRHDQVRRQASTGQQIAAQIAAKIQAYWEAQAVKQERWKVQEDKRLRTLAKATIKMVITEWKKAVFHLREQARLKREEEELRRGHEHLDAILNQSGHILETQHVDLSRNDKARSHSRASSTSTDMDHWVQDGEDDDDGETSSDSGSDDGGSECDTVSDGSPEGKLSDEDADDMKSTSMILTNHVSIPGPSAHSTEIPSSRSSPASESFRGDEVVIRGVLVSEGSPPVDATELVVDESLSSSIEDGAQSRSPSSVDVLTPKDSGDLTVLENSRDLVQDKGSISTVESLAIVEVDRSPDLTLDREDHKVSQINIHPSSSFDIDSPGQPSECFPQGGSQGSISLNGKGDGDLDGVDLDNDATSQECDDLSGSNVGGPTEPAEDPVEPEDLAKVPEYLEPYLVAPVHWDPNDKLSQPLLLRGVLRPYQFSGLEWLASLHSNNLNGILADEMGLGKTIQTISLLAHLACGRGIWGPHLIIVPTSVLLNWEMEFKKFLPSFKILSYHGNTKRRKELRQGWNDKLHFNVCITSYTLASRDAHIFKRKAWYYMVLDEAHMIKNFKSQRWNILLMFRSFRRLLLTGTPLQNNLTELWALLQFLMSGTNFANLKEFGDWFSNPLEKAIEMGNILDDETVQRVSKLHTVLRPYLLRRLKRDVEKELPSKYEHLVLCPLSKRQRFLYDEFMARAQTRDALQSGVYQKIANILMQLRKVCNHPDLFEIRPIVTSFAMQRSAVADFEIKELLIRRRLLYEDESEKLNLGVLGLSFIRRHHSSLIMALETRRLDATPQILAQNPASAPPPKDTRTIKGFREYSIWQKQAKAVARWTHLGYLNNLKCTTTPIYSSETIFVIQKMYEPIIPTRTLESDSRMWALRYLDTVTRVHDAVLSYTARAENMKDVIERFAFVTPPVAALDLPRISVIGESGSFSRSEELEQIIRTLPDSFDASLHLSAVKLQIAFPDPSLLQYDCGKLQVLAQLLREKKIGGHRVLIFTQMTRILDVLEMFLNFHGWLYLRLDGATKIEDRQYVTERFNRDERIFCFISSSRSGGVGINLTGADTVIFYDSDFNPQMDRQCEDRAHRIGQIRDVHIYRLVSQHTVEEAMLRKANQKRSLDDLVIQKGEFNWRVLFSSGEEDEVSNAESASKPTFADNERALLTRALEEFEDVEDTNAARIAEKEEGELVGADEADFDERGGENLSRRMSTASLGVDGEEGLLVDHETGPTEDSDVQEVTLEVGGVGDGTEDEGGTVVEYMLAFIQSDAGFFEGWTVR